jgi:hypothetical protein
MRRLLLISLLALAPALAQAGAAAIGSDRTISTGTITVFKGDGPWDSNIISTFSQTNPGYVAQSSTWSVFAVPVQRQQSLNGSFFFLTTGFNAIGVTTETDYLLIVNLSTNTKNIYLDDLHVSSIGSGNNDNFAANAYYSPVVTSSGTPIDIDSGKIPDIYKSQMQADRSPTISNRGDLFISMSSVGDTMHHECKQAIIL